MTGTNSWKNVSFEYILPEENRKTNRIIGLSFPENGTIVGLEPSVLAVLPQGDNVEYAYKNIEFNDNDVQYYLCSVYISGYVEFKEWAMKHDRKKIVVGGYHPTSFPEDFVQYAFKIVQGTCDDFFTTIAQEGQVVQGITSYKNAPRYDLYDITRNQQVIPEKRPTDICTSINTSYGCPYRCDFCCTTIMSPKLVSKSIELVEKEVDILSKKNAKWCFIRDENFPLQKDWRTRLNLIKNIGARIYLFASANLLTNEDDVKYMADHGVYMICLGLEDVTTGYAKNKNLLEVTKTLKKYGIYTYLSFIVNPLKIVGKESGEDYYNKLNEALITLKPEMICGNFLMPFRGTKLWDDYYQFVSEEDYKYYDSKTAFLVRNKILREKMHFFMFWNQWKYYTSDLYNKEIRYFHTGDTLNLRFLELYEQFKHVYNRLWDRRC